MGWERRIGVSAHRRVSVRGGGGGPYRRLGIWGGRVSAYRRIGVLACRERLRVGRRIGVWAKRGGGDRRIGVSAFGPVYGGRGTAERREGGDRGVGRGGSGSDASAYRRIGVVAGGGGKGGRSAYRRIGARRFLPLSACTLIFLFLHGYVHLLVQGSMHMRIQV